MVNKVYLFAFILVILLIQIGCSRTPPGNWKYDFLNKTIETKPIPNSNFTNYMIQNKKIALEEKKKANLDELIKLQQRKR